MMISSSLSVFFLFLSSLGWCEMKHVTTGAGRKLMVVSLDGFHPRYLNLGLTPNIEEFQKNGAAAPYMTPVFPTQTFVNHHSIATGLYPENHGVLCNKLFDRELNEYKTFANGLWNYTEAVKPIWTENIEAGKYTGCMWPGADDNACTFTLSFREQQDLSFVERVDRAMGWFTDENKPANLVMFYVNEPDGMAHTYGADSQNVTDAVKMVDRLVGYIQSNLEKHKLDDEVNVILLSDHGMTDITPEQYIDLHKYVSKDLCDLYGVSPLQQIVPKEGKESEVFEKLTQAAMNSGQFKVYNEETIPGRWHANNTMRFGPIIALAELGYAFMDHKVLAESFTTNKKYNHTYNEKNTYGLHGYDNEEEVMRAIFMANGPMFSKGTTLEPVNTIDMHNLFCSILGIKCNAGDGSTNPKIWDNLFQIPQNQMWIQKTTKSFQ